MIGMVRAFAFLAAMFVSTAGFAAATIESSSGDVRAGATAATASAVRANQLVDTGAFVVTGPKSRVTLRFSDGQAVALHENTEFRITDYAFSRAEPARDRSSFDLLKGAMRSVSGVIAQRSPDAFRLRTSAATIGIRGTDFVVAVVNPLFFQIRDGSISVVNSAGAPVFGPGAIGTVAADGTLALSVPASSLPPGVLQAFNQLNALVLAGVPLSEVPTASPTLPGTLTPGVLIPGAIFIGIGILFLGGDDESRSAPATGTGP